MSSDYKRRLFNQISRNKNYFNKDDVKELYKSMNIDLTEYEIDLKIRPYDTNEDGQISLDEFNSIDLNIKESTLKNFYSFICNKNKDDIDFQKFEKTILKKNIQMDAFKSYIMKKYDLNNDGKVSEDDFVKSYKKIFKI